MRWLMWMLVAALPGAGRSIADEPPQAPGLAVVEAGVSSSEDAPFVTPDYSFMPGDYVYFVFQIAGFKSADQGSDNPRKINLRYRIAALDAHDIALAPPEDASIEQEVGSEDKDWQPKRRASFLLPSYVAAGTYKIRVSVEDSIAKVTAARDFPFRIGGVDIRPGTHVSVQNFRFLRDQEDGPGLEEPAYRPGDPVWGRFEMTGFKLGPENTAELKYGVFVRRPDGSTLFEDKVAASQKITGQYYPPAFLPGSLSVNTTRDLPHGEYTLNVHVTDIIGKQESDYTAKFRIE